MARDVPSPRDRNPGASPLFVSVRGDDAETLTRYWESSPPAAPCCRLSARRAFSPLYGMVKDAFGVTWVFDLQVAYPAA